MMALPPRLEPVRVKDQGEFIRERLLDGVDTK
jgi:hypothetical protein